MLAWKNITASTMSSKLGLRWRGMPAAEAIRISSGFAPGTRIFQSMIHDRTDTINHNLMRSQFGCQTLGQADDSELGGTMGYDPP